MTCWLCVNGHRSCVFEWSPSKEQGHQFSGRDCTVVPSSHKSQDYLGGIVPHGSNSIRTRLLWTIGLTPGSSQETRFFSSLCWWSLHTMVEVLQWVQDRSGCHLTAPLPSMVLTPPAGAAKMNVMMRRSCQEYGPIEDCGCCVVRIGWGIALHSGSITMMEILACRPG